jgi:hypothetical protein
MSDNQPADGYLNDIDDFNALCEIVDSLASVIEEASHEHRLYGTTRIISGPIEQTTTIRIKSKRLLL